MDEDDETGYYSVPGDTEGTVVAGKGAIQGTDELSTGLRDRVLNAQAEARDLQIEEGYCMPSACFDA